MLFIRVSFLIHNVSVLVVISNHCEEKVPLWKPVLHHGEVSEKPN